MPEKDRLTEAVVGCLREGAGASDGAAAIVEPISRDVPVGNLSHEDLQAEESDFVEKVHTSFDHLVGALQDCFGKVMPNALRLKTIKRRIAESGSVVCIYIPGNGMISTISIHAPGICRWGWSLSNIFVAASCDSACTTE